MRIRESGMPDQALWESFFDPVRILDRLGLTSDHADVVEFGCGYGTFTLEAARRASGTVFALDIDEAMIAIARRRAGEAGLANIEFIERDFMRGGTGLADGCADFVMLFNILHGDQPVELLREARRNLRAGGSVAVIHWAHDRETPRGPPMAIRPSPEQCREWAEEAGLDPGAEVIDLPPHHFGLRFDLTSP